MEDIKNDQLMAEFEFKPKEKKSYRYKVNFFFTLFLLQHKEIKLIKVQ